jgi:hypothetical protein
MTRLNKYNNKKTEYNGNIYHSKLEADFAFELDVLLQAGEIKKWERQIGMMIDVNDIHIGNYIADFKVTHNDNSEEIIDVKGVRTSLFNFKWRIVKALYPQYKYTIKTKNDIRRRK